MNMRASIKSAQIAGPVREDDGDVAFEFQFQANDPTFAGHFPERPLLPGVFQLEMTRAAAEIVEDRPLTIREILKAKFRRPILPDEVIQLRLKLKAGEDSLTARAQFSVEGRPSGEALLSLC